MSHSKQLGGFPTSGGSVSDTRRARPAVAEPIYAPATGRPAHIGVISLGIASDEHFIAHAVEVGALFVPTNHNTSPW